MILQQPSNYYELVQANALPAVVPAQTVIDTDGSGVYFTGGAGNGTDNGAVFQCSRDNGASWAVERLDDNGWSTPNDIIQAVDVTDGIVTVVVTNGTDTKQFYSFDCRNWVEIKAWVGTTATNVDIQRPTNSITYTRLDCAVYVNHSGLCDCSTEFAQQLPDCTGKWGICQNDPFYIVDIYG